MFRCLRNRLVLINVAVTTVVLIVAFCTIFLVAQTSVNKRPLPPSEVGISINETKIITEHVRRDRKQSLESLVIVLITVGTVVEVAVILVSLMVADLAIRPVRESYEAQKDFIADASHEMKTPLAAIAANLEAADIQNNHWIDNVENELSSLTHINQDLLALVSAENTYARVQDIEVIVVKDFLQETISAFELIVQKKKLKIRSHVLPKTSELRISVSDLRQILRILVDNATKYAQKNIDIYYSEHEFRIENDGETIPIDKIAHVFQRFYQVDKNADGSGLGLAIAKALAARNNWKILVTSGKTTVFSLKVK